MASLRYTLHFAGLTAFELSELVALAEFCHRNDNAPVLDGWLSEIVEHELWRRRLDEPKEPLLFDPPVLDPVSAAQVVRTLAAWLSIGHTPRTISICERIRESAIVTLCAAADRAYHKDPEPRAEVCLAD